MQNSAPLLGRDSKGGTQGCFRPYCSLLSGPRTAESCSAKRPKRSKRLEPQFAPSCSAGTDSRGQEVGPLFPEGANSCAARNNYLCRTTPSFCQSIPQHCNNNNSNNKTKETM